MSDVTGTLVVPIPAVAGVETSARIHRSPGLDVAASAWSSCGGTNGIANGQLPPVPA